jgi:hypothetical protein
MPAKPPARPAKFPTFRGGEVLVGADRLKDVLHGVEGEPPPGNEEHAGNRRRGMDQLGNLPGKRHFILA